jgi:hypothetical protein
MNPRQIQQQKYTTGNTDSRGNPFHPWTLSYPVVKVYKGKYKYKRLSNTSKYQPSLLNVYDSNHNKLISKVLVFDLDETIGCFTELHTIWTLIFQPSSSNSNALPPPYINENEKQVVFNELLDLYPEFLRVGILQILGYVYSRIVAGECHKIYLYTNNQCEYPDWVKHIVMYLNLKITGGNGHFIFERPICAFKIKNVRIEPKRTSTDKIYDDFIACSFLPKSTEICYLDDKKYEKMKHDKVYYIQPPPYYHDLKHKEIYDRFIQSSLFHNLMKQKRLTVSNPLVFKYPEIDPTKRLSLDQHQHIYTKMMYYIREFFIMTTKRRNTRKSRYKIGRFSRKKYRYHHPNP